MGIALTHYSFGFEGTIGEINDAKVEKLEASFKEQYPMLGRQSGGSGVVLLNPKLERRILLAPQRIVFDNNGSDLQIDCTTLAEEVGLIKDLFILDNVVSGTFRFVSRIKEIENNAMGATLRLFDLKNHWDDLMGVGLRCLFDNSNGIWEFMVEPLLVDEAMFHLEGICNYSKLDLDCVCAPLQESYSFFRGKVKNVFEDGVLTLQGS